MNLSIFNQHKNDPKNWGIPPYCSSDYQWKQEDKEVSLFLEIDKYDVIKECHYDLKNLDSWIPYFSMLSQEVINLSLSEAMELSFTDLDFYDGDQSDLPFFPMPIFCLHQAIRNFRGVLPPKAAPEDMICRCFGVSKTKIDEILKQNIKYGIKDISEKTQATAGCSSCREDIEEIVYDFQCSSSEKIVTSYGGDEKFLEKINDFIKKFLDENSLGDFYKIEVQKRENLELKVKIEPENKKESIVSALETYLKDEMGLNFLLLL